MARILNLFRSVTFLLVLCSTLAVSTASLAVRSIQLSAEVATAGAHAAALAIQHRKSIATVVARAKAKARLRRVVAVIPIAGAAAVIAFERADFLEWLEQNPDGDLSDYSCEVANISAEVVDEVLQDLPERVRPSSDFILSQLPECHSANDKS